MLDPSTDSKRTPPPPPPLFTTVPALSARHAVRGWSMDIKLREAQCKQIQAPSAQRMFTKVWGCVWGGKRGGGGAHLCVVMPAQGLDLPQAALYGPALGRVLLRVQVRIGARLWRVVSLGGGPIQEHQAGLVASEDVVDKGQAYQGSCDTRRVWSTGGSCGNGWKKGCVGGVKGVGLHAREVDVMIGTHTAILPLWNCTFSVCPN